MNILLMLWKKMMLGGVCVGGVTAVQGEITIITKDIFD